jgi:hypothetical protein
MKKYTFLLLIGLLYFYSNGFAQEVLQLKDSEVADKGKLSDIAWLTGNWKGTGLGGTCDELWMPAGDSSMQGIFRFYEKGRLQFTEYMNLTQENDGTLSVKLKHFSADLSPWEEKEDWTIFKLIKLENQTAYFNGMTYHRIKNKLVIKLHMHNKEKEWLEEFVFYKKKL